MKLRDCWVRGPAISLPQSTVGGGDLRPAWGQGTRGVSWGSPAASVSPLLSLCLAGLSRGSCEPGSGRLLSGITRQPPFPPGLLPRVPLPHPRRALCGGPRQSGSSLPALLPVPASACRGVTGPSRLGPDRRTERPLVASSPAGPSPTPGGLPGPSRCRSTTLEPEEPAALGTQAAWRHRPRRDLLLFQTRGHLELTLPLDPP